MQRHRRAVGYARVSSEEQARGSSLRDQQASICRYAKDIGLTVDRVYVEAESAIHEKIERRVQIQALLDDVRAGDLVVVDKLDRWSRDPEFTYRSVRDILAKGANFYAVSDRCDPSTSEGDTALGFRILFAREEHKRIRERTVGTRKLLRDRGFYVEGLPPFGYRRALPPGQRGPDKNVLVIVPEEADLVRTAFKLAASGRSLNQITVATGMKRDLTLKTLRRRVYLGEILNSLGQWIPGKHPPIVDTDLFVRANTGVDLRRLGPPRTGTAETSTWWLRDLAVCGACGAKLGGAYAGPMGPGRRHYYRCSARCGVPYVPVRAIELSAEPLFVARLVELREWLAKGPAPVRTKTTEDFAGARTKLAARRERYLETYADGHIDRDTLRTRMAKLDAEMLTVDGRAAEAARKRPLDDPKVHRAILASVAGIERAWRNADPARRCKLAAMLATSVAMQTNEEPRIAWRSPEDLASNHA